MGSHQSGERSLSLPGSQESSQPFDSRYHHLYFMPFSGLMTRECRNLINNICWCEAVLKLAQLPSGSSERPQPWPCFFPAQLCSVFITAFSITHHHPSHSPYSPSPFSIIALPILHSYLLHPPSSSFPSCILFSILHPYPCGGGSAKSQHPQQASTEPCEPPAKRLLAHDLKFRDFIWTPLGKKGVEQSRSVP